MNEKAFASTRPLAGRQIAPIGFGPMRCSYKPLPERSQAIMTIHAALDGGAQLIDTADCYAPSPSAMHHNEALLAEALEQWPGDRHALLIATKGGHVRTERAVWENCGDPRHLREACERSLRALRVERIGLYQLHSPDPKIPFEDQVGALAGLRDDGKIGAIGLCNVGRRQLALAREIVPIASVQNRYSIGERGAESVLRACEAQGIAFLAWSPLDAGAAADAVARIAASRAISPQRIMLAWLLARSPVLIPLVGATRPETARDSLSAADIQLDASEIDAITIAAGEAEMHAA